VAEIPRFPRRATFLKENRQTDTSQPLARVIFDHLEARADTNLSRILTIFITVLISLNIAAVVVGTLPWVELRFGGFLKGFEVFSVVVFTVEYLLRVATCTADPRYRGAFIGRLRFAMTGMALVDLVAILPFFLPMLVRLDLRFVRALRLFRLFRFFKMARYSESLQTLANVFRAKREELLITGFVVLILLVFSASAMFYIEHEKQPEVFSSIPAAMWWAIVTLTSVGYGDAYPVTTAGKFVAGFICVMGIGMVALPAGILASGFNEELGRGKPAKEPPQSDPPSGTFDTQEKNTVCPHCGKRL